MRRIIPNYEPIRMLRTEVDEVFKYFHKGSTRKNKSEINRTIWKLPKSKDVFDAISLSVW